MEPVTLILTALVAGVASGATDVGKEAVTGAWHRLRDLVRDRFGSDEDAASDLNVFARKPTAENGEALSAQLLKHHVDQDADVAAAAQEVVDLAGPAVGPNSLAASVINQIVERGAAIGVSNAPVTLTFNAEDGGAPDPRTPGPVSP